MPRFEPRTPTSPSQLNERGGLKCPQHPAETHENHV